MPALCLRFRRVLRLALLPALAAGLAGCQGHYGFVRGEQHSDARGLVTRIRSFGPILVARPAQVSVAISVGECTTWQRPARPEQPPFSRVFWGFVPLAADGHGPEVTLSQAFGCGFRADPTFVGAESGYRAALTMVVRPKTSAALHMRTARGVLRVAELGRAPAQASSTNP